MRRPIQILIDEILHLIIDLDRMDPAIRRHALRHTQCRISRISPDLQDSLGRKHTTEHFQDPTLQMPRQHTGPQQVHVRVAIQRGKQLTFIITM